MAGVLAKDVQPDNSRDTVVAGNGVWTGGEGGGRPGVIPGIVMPSYWSRQRFRGCHSRTEVVSLGVPGQPTLQKHEGTDRPAFEHLTGGLYPGD